MDRCARSQRPQRLRPERATRDQERHAPQQRRECVRERHVPQQQQHGRAREPRLRGQQHHGPEATLSTLQPELTTSRPPAPPSPSFVSAAFATATYAVDEPTRGPKIASGEQEGLRHGLATHHLQLQPQLYSSRTQLASAAVATAVD